mgnify:CR=1 FL=1
MINEKFNQNEVTILILVDGFLQYVYNGIYIKKNRRHNPYFSRWFSAIFKILGFKEVKIKSQSLF